MSVAFTTAIVIAGLLALFAGLLGTILWVDGKPRGQVKSGWLRALFVLVGLWLVYHGTSKAIELAKISAQSPDVGELGREIQELERRLASQAALLESLRGKQEMSLSLSERLVEDHRVLALRTGLLAMSNDDSDCVGIREGDGSFSWQEGDTGVCSQLYNALWTVEVVVPLVKSREVLQAKLNDLGITALVAESGSPHGGISQSLGMVFPDGTPLTLICAVHRGYGEATGKELAWVTSSSQFRLRSNNVEYSTHTIAVGVPKNLFFDEVAKTTSKQWADYCGGDYSDDTFADLILSQGQYFKPRSAKETDGG